MKRVSVIDSHTGGEPTRIVVEGGPDLKGTSAAEKLANFRRDHDRFRSAVVNEPRGSDVMVGALLTKPENRECVAGAIFFNNVGYLGMCGHGTIGLVVTLKHLGRIGPGTHKIETPVGIVSATLHESGEVTVANVPSWRKQRAFTADVPGLGSVTGDVAWGGNWFFLAEQNGYDLSVSNVDKLTEVSWRIRQAVNTQGFPEVDHVELFGPPRARGAHARNFVQCPGKAYDRSSCGTGTSVKLVCLVADGKLKEGDSWVQESIIGSIFTGRFSWLDKGAGKVAPTITGTAYVNSEATLLMDEEDPFCWGIAGPDGASGHGPDA